MKDINMNGLVIQDKFENDEIDIYTEEGMERYLDEDSITPLEQGFMIGYLGAWKCSILIFSRENLWNGTNTSQE